MPKNQGAISELKQPQEERKGRSLAKVCVSLLCKPTRSTYVYGNLICMELTKVRMCEWYIVFKVKQGKVIQGHATLPNKESCNRYAESNNATQGHATSCKVMHSYVIIQGKASHTPQLDQLLLSCRNILPVFKLFHAVWERWLFTTGKEGVSLLGDSID